MVEYNPFSDEVVRSDPFPIYKPLRDKAPAYYLEEYDTWALSRFEDKRSSGSTRRTRTARSR